METTKEKIDKALGLAGAKSIDEMLDDMNLSKEKDEIDQLAQIEGRLNESFDLINQKAQAMTRSETANMLSINDMNDSLRQVEGLIDEARCIFAHVKDGVLATELIDSESIEAAAKLLESIHVNINEFVSVYRAKQKFVEKVKLMIFAQEQKKELMELKHRHDLEVIEAKKKDASPESVDAEGVSFDTDRIIKELKDADFGPVRFGPDGIPEDEGDDMDEIERLGAPKDRKNPFDK